MQLLRALFGVVHCHHESCKSLRKLFVRMNFYVSQYKWFLLGFMLLSLGLRFVEFKCTYILRFNV